MFIGAINAENDQANNIYDILSNNFDTVPNVLFFLFLFVLFCFVLFCFVLFCFVLFCFLTPLQVAKKYKAEGIKWVVVGGWLSIITFYSLDNPHFFHF